MMNVERDNLESMIIASAVNNEDFFILLKAKGVKNIDFKNQLCSMIYRTMEDISEKNIAPKSYNIENKIVTNLLHEGVSTSKIEEIVTVFEYILSKKEDDFLACNVLMEKFIKLKAKDNLIDILDGASELLSSADAKNTVDYIFDRYYEVNSVEKKDITSISFQDLMKKNLGTYSCCVKEDECTSNGLDNIKL